MSKYWKSLNIGNYQAISDEVYNYVVNHTEILNNLLDKKNYYFGQQKNYFFEQPISYMLRHCPLLVNFLNSQQLVPTILGIIVVGNHQKELGMHKDNDGSYPWLRILWPVKNCQGSKTKIWQVPENAGEFISNADGVLLVNYPLDQERHLLEEFELSRPVLFDASSAHSVETNTELSGYRISLTIGFDRDLPISKSIKAWAGTQL